MDFISTLKTERVGNEPYIKVALLLVLLDLYERANQGGVCLILGCARRARFRSQMVVPMFRFQEHPGEFDRDVNEDNENRKKAFCQ